MKIATCTAPICFSAILLMGQTGKKSALVCENPNLREAKKAYKNLKNKGLYIFKLSCGSKTHVGKTWAR